MALPTDGSGTTLPDRTVQTPSRASTATITPNSNITPSFTPTAGTEGIINTRAMSIASQEAGERGGSRERGMSPSPRMSLSSSLQAAAAVNAGLKSEEECSRRNSISSLNNPHSRTLSSSQTPSTPHQRRRSTVLLNLQMNDPTTPAPGEMITTSPHPQPQNTSTSQSATPRSLTASPALLPLSRRPSHHRNPSLGEIHQELEQEQEAQVNRLLQMIRVQQAQLLALQQQRGFSPTAGSSSAIAGDEMPHFDPLTHTNAALSSSPRVPVMGIHPRSSFDLARSDIQRRSRTPSRNASPSFRSPSTGLESSQTWNIGDSAASNSGVSTKDESAFYQAETQMMIRENQMLRQRIRELERLQLEGKGEEGRIRELTREPSTPSSLLRGVTADEGEGQSPRGTPGLKERSGEEGEEKR